MIRPLVLVLVSVFASVSPAPVAATPRQAAGSCTGTSGVTVVVDFQELGGGVNVVCASGPVSSGLDALTRAGISYRTAQRFPGFVCRIADKPATDPCVNASRASAYWTYWLAAPGGTWCYATLGAGSRQPPPGTFEGWSFSLDKVAAKIPPPRFTPPAATTSPAPTLNGSDCTSTPQPPVATTATTAPPTSAPPTTSPPTTAPPTTRPSTTAPTVAPTTSLATTVTTTALTSTTTLASTTTATSPTTAPPTTAVDLGDDGGDGGSPAAFIASAAVVVGLGAAGLVIVRRRARARP